VARVERVPPASVAEAVGVKTVLAERSEVGLPVNAPGVAVAAANVGVNDVESLGIDDTLEAPEGEAVRLATPAVGDGTAETLARTAVGVGD